jgi:hypothetical protein
MSANNMSDEELDNLFRKSAEGFDPPFDPEAWKAMDQKLDQVQARVPWYKRVLPLILLLSVLLVPLLITQLKDEKTKPTQKEDAVVAVETPPATAATPLGQPAHQDETTEMAGAGEGKLAAELEGSVESPAPASLPPSTAIAASVKGEIYHTEKAGLPLKHDKSQQDILLPVYTVPFRDVYITDSLLSEAVATANGAEALPQQQTAEQPLHGMADSTARVEAAPAPVAAESSKSKKTSPFARTIRLAVLAAPDLTTVKFRNPDAVSVNAGVVVGVPLTKRLSIVTGVVWANKVYGASPEDYNPGAGYWQGKRIPDAIDARCRVLDIPLNLEYRLLQRNRSALAVQAGFSSYIMLDEEYTYIYGSGYRTYEKTWEVRNQNRHWFKVQNISLSYTHHLTPSLFIGAEPFVKIPLSGIGAGNVKLTSAGIFFTAGYTLPLRK